jgi:hypothetical protein
MAAPSTLEPFTLPILEAGMPQPILNTTTSGSSTTKSTKQLNLSIGIII